MNKGEATIKAKVFIQDLNELVIKFVNETGFAPNFTIKPKRITWFKKDGNLCYDVFFKIKPSFRKLDPNKKWWQFWKA